MTLSFVGAQPCPLSSMLCMCQTRLEGRAAKPHSSCSQSLLPSVFLLPVCERLKTVGPHVLLLSHPGPLRMLTSRDSPPHPRPSRILSFHYFPVNFISMCNQFGRSTRRFTMSSIPSRCREMLSTHSSPYKTLERRPPGGRSMPTTPVLTRNAYSSSHLE